MPTEAKWILLVPLALILVPGFLFLRNVQEGLKQEAGISATVVFQSKRIEQAGTCGMKGKLRGLGIYHLIAGLGGTVERLQALESPSASLTDRVYLVTLLGRRILVTGANDNQHRELPELDGQVKINGGSFGAGEVELDSAKMIEILHFVYPGIDVSVTQFDWKHNVCTVALR